MATKTQIVGIVNDMPHTLSRKVLERYMTEREIQLFWDTYRKNRKSGGNRDRFEYVQKEVTKEDKQMIREYLNKDISNRDMVKKYEKNYGYKVRGVALRILAQGIAW